jgi:hypothetical protein
MRINSVPPTFVLPEGPSGVRPVAGAGAASPAEASRENVQRQPQPQPNLSPPIRYEEVSERRQFARRGAERRTRQLPVMLDTRVGPRRTGRRRDEDDHPGSVDVAV